MFPELEICDDIDNDCDGEVDEDTDGEDCLAVGTGRCGDGVLECKNGNLTCVPFGALPELCNGLDDDCDGDIDNISVSWSKSAFSSTAPEKQARTRQSSTRAICLAGGISTGWRRRRAATSGRCYWRSKQTAPDAPRLGPKHPKDRAWNGEPFRKIVVHMVHV